MYSLYIVFIVVTSSGMVSSQILPETSKSGQHFDTFNEVHFSELVQLRLSVCESKPQSCHGNSNDSCDACSCKYCENRESCCTDVETSPMRCVRPQLFKYGISPLDTADSFMMITTCNGNKWSEDLVHNCSLGEKHPVDPYLEFYRPVTSSETNSSYRNIYCAFCNSEYRKHIRDWSVELACASEEPTVFNSRSQFMKDILQQKLCNLYFKPIEKMNVTMCYWGIITECNMTGKWLHFNAHIKTACNKYFNLYEAVFKNAYCYICNNDDPILGCLTCPKTEDYFIQSIGSFNALLDFRSTSASLHKVHAMEVKCPISSIYDRYKNTCRPVQCPIPFKYKHGKCEDAYKAIRKIRYDLFLRFEKGSLFNAMHAYCVQTAGASVYSYINHLIQNLPFGSNLCHVTVLQKPLTEKDFKFLIVHVEIFTLNYNETVHSVASTLLKSLSMLNQTYGRPNDCMTLQPQVLNENIYDVNKQNIGLIPMSRSYFDPTDKKSLIVDHPLVSVTNTFNNVCPYYSYVFRVAEINLCPVVNISIEDFNGTFNNSVMCLNEINVCLTSDKYIYNVNSSSVQICSDIVLSQSSKKTIFKSTLDRVEKILSFICSCLSIVCLMFTVITYSLFASLRTLPGLNNMALSVSLMLAHGLYTFGVNATSNLTLCLVLGIVIHFMWLYTVFMMNVCSINMFRAFKQIKQKSTMTVKQKQHSFGLGLLYCFLASASVIVTNIVYNIIETDGKYIGYGGNVCFINNHLSLICMFGLPIGMVVFSNIVMFVLVVVQIHNLPDIQKSSQNHRQNTKIYAKLSTLTGITWIFGFLQNAASNKIFSFLFIVINASQGLFIMVSFICNIRVYQLYRNLWKKFVPRDSRKQKTEKKCSSSQNQMSTSTPHVHSNHLTKYGLKEMQNTKL